ISAPLLAVARGRAEAEPPGAAPIRFVEADVENADLGTYRQALSRFGVMFFPDSARAFANIARLKGETADVLSDWGEALAAAGEGTVTPEAKALFEKAQAKDQNAPKPRFYLARAAEQAGDTAEAIRQLSALEAASPADAPWLGLVRQNLARLKGEAAPAAAPPAPPKIPAEQ
ncbi:tetratricopeptide repeat protein, partial [Psychrobacter sp. 1Y9]|uniref:tetratricopeptide repeat protein n=1 Tax=Psychrobacter sp. 1Y9 TaxID=3457444 RepID=UPI003FD1FFDE